MLNQVSQTKTNTIWFHLGAKSKVWDERMKKKKQTKQKQTHRYREQVVARGERAWGMDKVGNKD